MDPVQTAALRRAVDALRLVAGSPRQAGPRFSLSRMLVGLADGGNLDGFEREVLETATGEEFNPGRPVIPLSLLARDMTAAGSSGSDYLVETETPPPVTLLRPWSVVARAGVNIVDAKGNATVPVVTARPSITWLSDEATALTGVQPTIGSLAFTPKHAAALTVVSGQLLRQSPYADELVRRQLLEVAGIAADTAVLNGAGNAGEPLGLLNDANVAAQSGSSLAYTGVLAMKEAAAAAGAMDENIAFVGATDTRELLEARERAAGSGFIWDAGKVAGVSGYASSTMPSATLLCGDFTRVTLAVWGLEVLVDPFTLFKTGAVQYRVSLLCDVGSPQPGVFRKSSSIT